MTQSTYEMLIHLPPTLLTFSTPALGPLGVTYNITWWSRPSEA